MKPRMEALKLIRASLFNCENWKLLYCPPGHSRSILVLRFFVLIRVLSKVAENGAQSISLHIAKDFLYQLLKIFTIIF